MKLVSPRLPQRDACALLSVSPWCHRALAANPKLWEGFMDTVATAWHSVPSAGNPFVVLDKKLRATARKLQGSRASCRICGMVRELEDCPHFNAGKGSVLTSDGTVEMEASVMDGTDMRCGAVSGLSTVVNPISLARRVMDKTPHIYLAFDGAEAFARGQGVETRDQSHFITEENIERLKNAKEANRVQIDYTQYNYTDPICAPNDDDNSRTGTVGCVAVDASGGLASATSTGGLVNKMAGRIGDTPVIGAGTYANALCAVSTTGKGEDIIRHTVARDVVAVMEHRGLSLEEAAARVVAGVPRGSVGLVAVSAAGEVTMPYNTTGMFRACATEDGYSEVAIWPA
ncbi:unnamed protein product [Triticum turgidum subsp. durum]|uniref:beta-aspartyl-peptidase n=1 Tax=Triticum turgidum subsp. durum TaxID=4567 RepID=A0A9R0RAC7_TRITD|nr:unnamed protein product [Triticum turgidum subsp. durum]